MSEPVNGHALIAPLRPVIKRLEHGEAGTFQFAFHCPGCRCDHGFRTQGPQPTWQFNGDLVRPTLNPSYKVTWGRPTKGDAVCHSWIRDGQIQFCEDTTHELSGKTVALPPYDEASHG